MLRRSSLPARAFNNSKRDHRLSVPLTEAPPRQRTRGFVRVQVADFVTVPDDRLSQPRNALGPVDLAKRPPCYDLRPAVQRNPEDDAQPADHVFEISDREHMDRLRGIVSTSPDSSDDEAESLAEKQSVADAPSVAKRDEFRGNEDDNPAEEVREENGEDPVEEQLRQNSDAETEKRESYQPNDESDRELTQTHDDLREYDDDSDDVEEPVDPDLDFDKTTASASFIIASISEEDTTNTTVLSASSVADTSLSELPMIASVNTTDGNSKSPCSVPLQDEHPSMFVAVQSTEFLGSKKMALPSFMRKKVPSPVKYTFRPLHRVPSKIEEPESNEVTTIVPSEYPARPTAEIGQHSYTSSDSDSHDEQSSTKSPTLEAVKRVVDKIDPHAAISIAHVPPLALATVGLFRKKRDSEESIWSRRSDASSRKKRESDESTQSSNTEYYEDDYTKFIENKHGFPRPPLRLRSHPYFSKIVNADDGLLFSRTGFRRRSSLSVSTSDEEYIPLSNITQHSNIS